MKEKKIAAFFDIDGTIYRNALLIEHFKKLIKYELFKENKYRCLYPDDYRCDTALPTVQKGI